MKREPRREQEGKKGTEREKERDEAEGKVLSGVSAQEEEMWSELSGRRKQ